MTRRANGSTPVRDRVAGSARPAWIYLYTRRYVNPLDVRVKDVSIEALTLGMFETPLLDLQAACVARDLAVARAEAHAAPAFAVAALAAVNRLTRRLRVFIVDDVWAEIGDDWPATPDKRAMGAVMRRAVAAGLIEATADFRASVQKNCHANPRRV